MKKQLLIVLSVLPACVFAQNTTPVVDPKVNIPQPVLTSFVGTDQATSPFNVGKPYTPKLNKHIRYSSILIGKTFYDLQTNASVGRRIILHDDGKISAVWTTAKIGAAEWPSRGTGYNHKATSWLAPVNDRFETDRTGWPCIGVLDSAGTKYEMVMGHIATTGGWVLSKNSAIGSTSFPDQRTVLTQLNGKVAIWGRIGTNNKKIIHLVSNYNGNATTGDPPVIKIKGVSNPTTYSRSTNGGLTWDKMFTALPGYDSTRTLFGGGDNYAIDVKDNIVAIVIGGIAEDVALYKSIDNGNTFTRTVVEEFPFSPFLSANKNFIPNATPMRTADGSFDVLIGNDNKVHVFFGRSFISDEDTVTDGYSFFPGTGELVHWAEGWDSVNTCGIIKDYNQSGKIEINRETFSALENGNVPAGLIAASRYGANTSLVSFPSSSMDANGNLYVIYSAPDENAVSSINSNFRDVYVSFSTDGGITWDKKFQNVTASASNNLESVFASAAKRCDNFLHFIYQEDELPGTNLQNNGNSNTHPNDEQRIMYKAIPIADILGGQVMDPTSVKRVTADPKIFFVSQNQPNPFSSETEAFIYMRDGSNLNLTVSDITGKVVRNENLGYHSAGNHSITINADGLTAGLYFYTIANNQYTISQKMQVK